MTTMNKTTTYTSVAPLKSAEERIAEVQRRVAANVEQARKVQPCKSKSVDDVWSAWLLK